MLRDLVHACRLLLQAKGWTAVVVLSLALGIGANTALFSAVNGLLLTTISVDDPDMLVRLRTAGRNDMVTSWDDHGVSATDANGLQLRSTFSYPIYREFVAANRTMTDLFACAPLFNRLNVVMDGQAEIATGLIASGNYFQVLNVTAVLGRTFTPEDDTPTAAPVAVISHRYWRSRFGGDPNVIGKTVRINDAVASIVGVLPPGFGGVQRPAQVDRDVTVPLALDVQVNGGDPRLDKPTWWWLQVMGRLKPGVTAAQVQGNLEGVFQHTARAGLDGYLGSLPEEERSKSYNQHRSDVPALRVDSGRHGFYDANPTDLRAVTVLGVVVALMLLIVCANVANLLLSRATTRQKEMSVRLSLGATQGRLIRQLLTESVVLASMGGALAIPLGHWSKRLLPGAAAAATPLDWRVLAFVAAISMLTAIICGLAPALRATGINVNGALKESSGTIVGSRALLGKALLVAQVGISLVLLIGAGLFLRTLQNLRDVDVGFNPHNLVLFRVSPQLNGYEGERTTALYRDMIARLGAVPGVRAVAFSQPGLMARSVSSGGLYVQGRPYGPGREGEETINRLIVSPDFFAAMEMPLLLGRGFSGADHESAPKVAVINEAAARRFFPDENPVGKRVGYNREAAGDIEIVGLLRDAKYNSVREAAPPTMYVPHLQVPALNPVFAIRSAGGIAGAIGGIRQAVREIDSSLPIADVSTQVEQVEGRILQERIFARAYAIFGGLALLLTSIGLFGLMSCNVTRRTNEIGIRMALGARAREVLALIMRESMVVVAIGVLLGVVLAVLATQLIESQLFGVAPTDTATMILAITVMVLVAALAAFLPARRAERVDPMIALRQE